MKKKLAHILIIALYIIFVLWARYTDIPQGRQAVMHLWDFVKQMVLLLPCAFVLIGLFEVWVKKESVEKYLGSRTGISAYLLAIALAGTTIGGLYVALPFACALHKKGATLGAVFTYLGCAGICRVPMTVFEASFLGLKFTLIRFAVSLPLVVLTSWIMERMLIKSNFEFIDPQTVWKK